MKRPRIMPPVYLLIAILGMIALHFVLPGARIIIGPWRWLGVVPFSLGLGLVLCVAEMFRRRDTTIKPGAVSTQLVTEGPFRISRNPIYLGMGVILAGVAIALGSLTPWLAVPVFVGLISWNIIPVEETLLEETFGQEYGRYRANVRRWI